MHIVVHESGQTEPSLVVCRSLVNLPLIHLWPYGESFMMRWQRVNPIQSSEKVLLPSTFQWSSMLLSSKLPKFVFASLFTSMYFRNREERAPDHEAQHDY